MTAPESYRKKPVVIDAIQWTGDNLRDVMCFIDGPPDTRTNRAGMMWEKYEGLVQREGLKIYTLEGAMNANIGDYIIKGVKGEFYPCKPDIFAATYDRADLAAVPARVRVKPLVWVTRADASLTSNVYSIGRSYGQGPEPFMVSHGSNIIGWSDSEEGCKRIANHHNRVLTLAALEPQPDPRDEVIARLVEALDGVLSWHDKDKYTAGKMSFERSGAFAKARAALAASKAVQK